MLTSAASFGSTLLLEGRDKFCKMIQYGARFIKFQAQGNNEEVMKAFDGLFRK